MPVIANKTKERKTETILGDATDRLLLATKKKILREKGRVYYDKLARDRFSAPMIARLKALVI
jgi:hypothetical protein